MPNPTYWDIFHDGGIVSARGQVPGRVEFTIEIEYLSEQFPESPKAFVLTIEQCTKISFDVYHSIRPFRTLEERSISDPVEAMEAISNASMDVFGAEQDGDTVTVHLSDGKITMQYLSESVRFDEGREVPLDELIAAANRSVEECIRESKKKTEP